MRNIDKYAEVDLAVELHEEYCQSHNCRDCKHNLPNEGLGACAIRWAMAEAEDGRKDEKN